MNTQTFPEITSCIVREYLEKGGTITRLETIEGDRPDETLHAFTVPDRDGTYVVDNAGVVWFDSTIDRVVDALRAGDTSELTSGSVARI